MVLMCDVVADAMGVEPTETNLWRATRGRGAGAALVDRVLAGYSAAEPEPVPSKTAREFRPAFMSDYRSPSATPYDREFSFVARSLCYADGVAVRDELTEMARRLAENPHGARLDWALGFPECSDGLWGLRRIIRYAPLERASLLHYVDAPTRPDLEEVRHRVDENAVRDLAPLVVEHRGYRVDHVGRGGPADPVRADLVMWLCELEMLLGHASEYEQHVDLYLPSWFPGRELLEWWARAGGGLPGAVRGQLHHGENLSRLIDLPSWSEKSIESLSPSSLVGIRQDDAFATWRSDLAEGLRALGSDVTSGGLSGFSAAMESKRISLNDRISRSSSISGRLGAAFTTGVMSAALSGATHQPAEVVAAAGAVPLAAMALEAGVARWLLAGEPGNVATIDTHYRLFSQENFSGTARQGSRPPGPQAGFTDMQGRPVDLGIFDVFDG